MHIDVTLLENFKMTATLPGFTLECDQPLSNNGEGSAPSPFDYFLVSTALCAGYFIKSYCQTRNLSTTGIKISQDNTKDPENKYKQTFNINVELPHHFSEKDREGIKRAIEGCTVKKAIQERPDFIVNIR